MLINPTTKAKTPEVQLQIGSTLQMQAATYGTHSIAIEIPNGAGGWTPLVQGGVEIVLDVDNNEFTSLGRTRVRVNKTDSGSDVIAVEKLG